MVKGYNYDNDIKALLIYYWLLCRISYAVYGALIIKKKLKPSSSRFKLLYDVACLLRKHLKVTEHGRPGCLHIWSPFCYIMYRKVDRGI